MNDRFLAFLCTARWTSAIVALAYHLRSLLFADYGAVEDRTVLTAALYFVTGLGHESFAVFFVLDGMLAGHVLLHGRHGPGPDRASLARHACAFYALLLTGLALGACLDSAGLRYANGAGVYTGFPELSTMTLGASALLGNLVMLQPFAVPTFGSNSMLYLLSYLFWCAVLLAAIVRTADAGRAGGVPSRAALAAAPMLLLLFLLLLPGTFLVWAAVWLCGVAAVRLGEAGRLKPPVPVAAAALAAACVASRLAGGAGDLLPQPFGAWLVEGRVWLVGAAFAALALALYPEGRESRAAWPDALRAGLADRAACFTFFFHFPPMLFLTGLSADVLGLPLVRQPDLAGVAAFACIGAGTVAACVVTVCAAQASARTVSDRLRRPPMRRGETGPR